jgi:hypothetical protein
MHLAAVGAQREGLSGAAAFGADDLGIGAAAALDTVVSAVAEHDAVAVDRVVTGMGTRTPAAQ